MRMNGAEALLTTLSESGINTCFANPGTSEMHFVSALDRFPGMRAVLTLAEGVATGAADGYARMRGAPAATLLHCGPGLANGLANLHNAKKAGVAVLNLIGDQAHGHRPLDPPLAAETENLARTVSSWTRTAADVHSLGNDAAAAVAAARSAGGSIASLILPSDVCWSTGAQPAVPMRPASRASVTQQAVTDAAQALKTAQGAVLMLGGHALYGKALVHAGRIARQTGVRLMAQNGNARIRRGWDSPEVHRIPYGLAQAAELLSDVHTMVLAGGRRPVLSFAGTDGRGRPEREDMQTIAFAGAESDLEDALERLAAHLHCPPAMAAQRPAQTEVAVGDVTPAGLAQSLAALLPDNAIVIDESISFGRGIYAATQHAARHDWLQLTGGAIGCGLPLSVGAAIAEPDRRVVCLQADGSALYTVQALWTQARERLNVTTVLISNRKYAILFDEMKRMGAAPGSASNALFELADPAIDWMGISRGFGVDCARAHSMEDFNALFQKAVAQSGPFLIELVA